MVYETDQFAVEGNMGATLFVDYIYLDTDEPSFRSGLARVLIEQLQFTGAESVPKDQENIKIKLNFNHPVKELIWTVRDNRNTSVQTLCCGGPVAYDFSTTP
jgi:hypothetical protein